MKTAKATNWTRREFTVQSALAMLSGVAITMSGCGDSSSSSTPSTPTPTPSMPAPAGANVTGVIGTNHGHTVVITAAQLTAGNAVSLEFSGSANHPHTVNLTNAEVGQIAGGTRVLKTSSNNSGHTHTVTFN